MRHPTLPRPSSSSASAPPLELRLKPSRLLTAWWCLLHALLAGAVALVAWPALLQGLGLGAVVGHGLARRPAPPPVRILLAEGGACDVPEWRTGMRPLGPRTIVAPFWARLDLGPGPWQRELLLMADQVDPEEWRMVRALLARARGD